ncbi:TniQ family protein [Priestia megaterium]|uniref:TniQ family protein n=1 Tax=Priestia megaterium TaxID=1404 RepID=UPI003CFD9520
MKDLDIVFQPLPELSIPARTYYYPLEAKGIGTMYVESLTSYVGRLALEHNVSVKSLIKDIMKSCLDNNLSGKSSYYNYNLNLNGNNDIVEKFVEALTQKVFNNRLKYHTIIPFKKVINHKGIFKQSEHWCKECYKEMKSRNESFHEPLIWHFSEVKICPKHQTRLVKAPHCKNCKNEQKIFKRHCSIYCSKCYKNLSLDGVNKDLIMSEEELGWQNWLIKNIGELLEVASSSKQESLAINRLPIIIDESLKKIFNNNERFFAEYLDIHSFSFLKLNNEISRVNFKTLLKLSYCTSIDLVEIFYSPVIDYNNKQPRKFPSHLAFKVYY